MSVQVNNLSKFYDQQKAVDNISFNAEKGEILGFLGPNGAGKTTTMKVITCFIPQSDGEVTVCGYNTKSNPMEVRNHIGYLPEHNPLYLDQYVKESLEFVARLHKLENKGTQRINEMIELTGLGQEQHKKIGQLSKGYRQRVGLAQAMLHNPDVLILDEPTSGLDPNQLVEIRQLIKTIGKEKTVILSSHIMQEVQALCDRVVIIDKGKLVANDTAEQLQLKASSTSTITVEFLEKVAKSDFASLSEVLKVEELANGRWHLQTSGELDIRPQIFRLAIDKGYTLLTLNREQENLEDVFRSLTS